MVYVPQVKRHIGLPRGLTYGFNEPLKLKGCTDELWSPLSEGGLQSSVRWRGAAGPKSATGTHHFEWRAILLNPPSMLLGHRVAPHGPFTHNL